MKNTQHFGDLTPRMEHFREELLETEPQVCAQRAILTTQSYKEHGDQPVTLKRAYMLQNILEHMSIFIEPDTLLAGNQASTNRAAPIFPEYAMDWVIRELDEFEGRDGDVFRISEKTKEELREIYPFWQHNTLLDKGLAAIPPESRVFYDLGIIKAEGNITSGDAHVAVAYADLLRLGLVDYQRRTREHLEELDLTDCKNLKKSYFYRAILIVIDAVRTFAARYAALAEEQAATAAPERGAELREMARILRKVPYEPAETFQEAVQSLWLVHLVLQIESNGHSLSYGRMDQYLYPYYARDLAEGRITEDSACELMTNLWLKTFTINKIRSWSHTQFSAGSPLYQNVTVGGQTPDKKDAVNPMSYLILRSVAQTRLPQPNLTVRYHAGLSEDFMSEAIEVVKLGFGMPAFNNDEIIIPSFVSRGVKEEDAYNYSAIGCVETAVPGKWGYRCTGMSFLNFPKSLLIAMNDGVDPQSGKKLTQGTGHFTDMNSYDQLSHAWDVVIRDFTRHSAIIENACDMVLEEDVPDILCSALCEDCIGRGLTLKEGGAVYDFISGLQVGIANLSDPLAAIKKLVFEEKKLTLREVIDACRADFKGYEPVREMLRNAPCYGNDDPYADSIAKDIDRFTQVEAQKSTQERGVHVDVRYVPITSHVPFGKVVSATPNGRHAWTALSDGSSASHGADKNGPTAVLLSNYHSKNYGMINRASRLLNIKLSPKFVAGEEGTRKIMNIIRTWCDLKLWHLQFNIVNKQTLIEAQKTPDNYRSLLVRIAGYSAYFCDLSRDLQNDIIERTEHESV